MIQFLNNIWMALSSHNPWLVSLISIPAGIVESYLFMSLFLIILNINSTRKQKIIYVLANTLLAIIVNNFIPNPINVLINYSSMFILIKFIFNLNLLNSAIALIVPIFAYGIFNLLIQNLYFIIFNINSDAFMNIPVHRIGFLTALYTSIFIICIFLKNFKKLKFNLKILDNLDKKTVRILIFNLSVGLLALCTQLITSAYYVDIVPTIINVLNFVLLISFMIITIYSFTRIVKLATTKQDLTTAEEYNKSLTILYDEVKGFKHDFDNIVSTLDGFIANNDMNGLKDYFEEVKRDCKITNNLAILNPRIINNPGIYSLLNNKYFKATNSGVTFDIDFFLNLNTLKVNTYEFSRILGILIDNAIEEAEKCKEKLVKISFIREDRNNRSLIIIENTYSNKNVDTEEIFKKNVSGKENHSGIGLWEVRKYVTKSKNLDLFTTKNDKFFKQELSIYDI